MDVHEGFLGSTVLKAHALLVHAHRMLVGVGSIWIQRRSDRSQGCSFDTDGSGFRGLVGHILEGPSLIEADFSNS